MGLELYAKIEALLGFGEEVEALYDDYFQILSAWQPSSLIDIGCGSGKFLAKVCCVLDLKQVYGVDLSEEMVRRTRQKGFQADAIDICEVEGAFDAATAVFDVLNYLSPSHIAPFLSCVADRLRPGGIFVADINTLVGFEEVAQGELVRSGEDYTLALDSSFVEGCLKTKIDFFSHTENGHYQREEDSIVQYYHTPQALATASESLELIQSYPLTMYAQEPDKEILLFRKR